MTTDIRFFRILAFAVPFVIAVGIGVFEIPSASGQNLDPFLKPASSARSNTMWNNRSQKRFDRLRGKNVLEVGDVLTVQIDVGTTVNNQDQRNMEKKTNANASGTLSATGAPAVDANYDTDSNRKMEGRSTLQESRKLIDNFTVMVRDVNPKTGNLLIQGKRSVLVQGDTRTILLSGIIRPQDITVDNSISSDRVASLTIRYDGKGPEQKYVREGWLMKNVSKVWPF